MGTQIESPSRTAWLTRDVLGMSLTSFFSDLGHEMATAILPLFIISIGAPPAALGAIEGVADALSSFIKLGAGWASDKVGRRKPIAVAGYLLTGLTTGAFALATTWPHVLIARSIGWLGRGIRGPVRDAMLADAVPPEARGRAFGFHRMGDTLGAVLGPALAFVLLGAFNYRALFVLTLIPGVLSALTFAAFVRERANAPIKGGNFLGMVNGLPTKFKLFLIGVGLFGAGDFAHSLLTLRAAQMLTPSLGAAQAGHIAIALYVLHNILYAGMSYPVGALADRFGKRGLLALGYLIAAVMGLGWMVAIPQVAYLSLLFALGGTFIAAEDALESAVAADLLPAEIRGTGYGVLATVNGLGDFISSLAVGALWTAVNPAAGFAYAVVLSVIGAVVVFWVR
jgi:MFS family permease